MFFTYAEKQRSMFYESWQLRQIAFDTTRRYMYYSDPIPEELLPKLNRNITREDYDQMSASHGDMKTGVLPSELTFKKKFKVFSVKSVATFHKFEREDPYVCEKDMFQMEIYCEERSVAKGERPSAEPLLCPSASPIDDWSRYHYSNDDTIRDPYFINELYDALRAQFDEIEREKNKAKANALAEGRQLSHADTHLMTIASPRTQGLKDVYSGIRQTKFVIRCLDERGFRRLWYVLETVLGYDKLMMRPYRGLPPYDPRNGLSFAHVPMHSILVFAEFDKTVFYTFIRGNVLGTNSQNELEVNLRGVYLAVTHDMLYFLRDSGNIPRWIRLQEIRRFEYNYNCQHPFIAVFSDRPAPDILFVPQPPSFGEEAVKNYDPRNDVKRVLHVMHTLCFGSLIVRRVFEIVEVSDASPRAYFSRIAESDCPLYLHPVPGYSGALNCPLPKEQLAQVWQQVHAHLRRQMALASNAAIPIYPETAPDHQLSCEALGQIERRLERERASENEIVGIAFDRVAELQMAVAAASPTSENPSGDGEGASGGRVEFGIKRNETLDTMSESLCSSYTVPGTRYYTQSEAMGVSALIQDQHTTLMTSPTSPSTSYARPSLVMAASAGLVVPQFTSQSTKFCQSFDDRHLNLERNVRDIVAQSMHAMEESTAAAASSNSVAT